MLLRCWKAHILCTSYRTCSFEEILLTPFVSGRNPSRCWWQRSGPQFWCRGHNPHRAQVFHVSAWEISPFLGMFVEAIQPALGGPLISLLSIHVKETRFADCEQVSRRESQVFFPILLIFIESPVLQSIHQSHNKKFGSSPALYPKFANSVKPGTLKNNNQRLQ